MIDKIISALESMQEDMEEHGELQKARGVSSAIWLIEIMRDWADRKTESNSEKPNNCEVKNYCDDCLYTDTCDSKAFFYACTSKATISKMEQVDKDINVRSKDEPQTNADQHVQHVESVEPTWTKEEHELHIHHKVEDEPQSEYPCEFCRNSNSQKCEECKDFGSNYEPQTDCQWK